MPANKKPQKETPDALAAYHEYCLLDPFSEEGRSLIVLARNIQARRRNAEGEAPSLNSIKNQLGIWSSAFGWQKKVKAYDLKQAELRAKMRARELEKMNETQAKQAQALAGLAIKQALALLKEDTTAQADKKGRIFRHYSPHALNDLIEKATSLERLARGAATEQTKLEVAGTDGGPVVIRTEWGTQKMSHEDDEE